MKKIHEPRYLMILVTIYILFLMLTIYLVKEDTRKQIQMNTLDIETMIEKKNTHVHESKLHDDYARDHLNTIITKLDDLNKKVDVYYSESMIKLGQCEKDSK